MINLETKITKEKVGAKAGGFADDVGAVCKSDALSVQKVFTQYERLTRRSGLTLNADKTEILALHSDKKITYDIEYMGKIVKLETMKEIKICGIWYCNDHEREYR